MRISSPSLANVALHSRRPATGGHAKTARIFSVLRIAFVLLVTAAETPAASESLLWRRQTSLDEVAGLDGRLHFHDVLDVARVNAQTHLPVFYSFTSSNHGGSSLGSGWSLFLLDSRIIPLAENEFEVTLPDGLVTTVKRDAKDPRSLSGCIAKGRITENLITLDCCEWKFSYTRGELTSMTAPDGSLLQIERSAEGSSTVYCQGAAILEAKVNTKSKRLDSLRINDRIYRFDYELRPIFGEIQGSRLVFATEHCLSRITDQRGTLKTFSYSADAQDPLTPQWTVAGRDIVKRSLKWDATTGRLIKDNAARVEVTTDDRGVIGLTRSYPDGSVDWYKRDDLRGVYERRLPSGETLAWKIHSSGLLAGSLRETQITSASGKAQSMEKFIYDENARLLRIVESGPK